MDLFKQIQHDMNLLVNDQRPQDHVVHMTLLSEYTILHLFLFIISSICSSRKGGGDSFDRCNVYLENEACLFQKMANHEQWQE